MNFEMSSAKMASSTLNNHMHYKVWDQITYPFTNSKGCTIKVWEWISNSPPLTLLGAWLAILPGI